MAEVATLFLSPLLQVFFEKMASGQFVDFFKRRKLSDELLEKLKIAYLTASAVLEDAEDLQVTKPLVKDWLEAMKDAVYDAEDILDEIATEALRSELDAESLTTSRKVRKSISAFRNSFVKEIEPKLKGVLERLETLANRKDVLRLREGFGVSPIERTPTTSLVDEDEIYGRDDDKEAIINMLLSDDAVGNKVGVIAVVGMGGIGKTTLAQLVYNDDRVKQYFDLHAWVCVSEQFDIFMITKTILEKVTSSISETKDLDVLQNKLKESLMGKKFLFILDDVWTEDYSNWENLSKPFRSGAEGSRVVLTTRHNSVALAADAGPTYCLKTLMEKACWSLFARRAFPHGNANAHPRLEELGRQIVKKCDGLPLAIKAVSALLGSKVDIDEWDLVLRSEIWDLPINETTILPSLRLSYKYLPLPLKRCFAYCSIFPKDYAFEKEQVILLWMAEGFLPKPKNKTMKEVGDDYFSALESRSLFQKSSGMKLDDMRHDPMDKSNRMKSHFIMHDLVNDLATFVSMQFTLSLKGDYSQKIVKNVRHVSYVMKSFDGLKEYEFLCKTNKLRTFLPLQWQMHTSSYLRKKIQHELLPRQKCLRVVSLSHYRNIIELPESIGKLKLLRYLDLSFTQVKMLPDSISMLCNLQTLNLSYCENLVALPREMWKLVNLHHLDIMRTGITEMPMQFGRLKCLQTLTKFIIGKCGGSNIGELRTLTNLQGSLLISELQNVESPIDAFDASLRNKKGLHKLEFEWNVGTDISEGHKTTLDALWPHANLKRLGIYYYRGPTFSNWIGHPSFSNLASIDLRGCTYCNSLPPLGQLPSLERLFIIGCDEVVMVSQEFYGDTSSSALVKPFRSLKVLRFEKMAKWQGWVFFGAENGGGPFPQLEELYIHDCTKLTGELPTYLPHLVKLEISNCPQLVASLPRAPLVCFLKLRDCGEVLFNEWPTQVEELEIKGFGSLESLPKGGLPSTLKNLHIIGFDKLESIPEGMINSSNHLQELEILCCSSLTSISKSGLPSSLKFLLIDNCMKLELSTHQDYSSIKKLSMINCDSLKFLPLEVFPKLHSLYIKNCCNLESLTLPVNYEHDLPIMTLNVLNCPNFVSFPSGGLRVPSLTRMWLQHCRSLRSLPDKMCLHFPSLRELLIRTFSKLDLFPKGGLPQSLTNIIITYKVLASGLGCTLQTLPFLRHLEIEGSDADLEPLLEAQWLPPVLNELEIYFFLNLESLDKKLLQHLNGLEKFSVLGCRKLKCLPKMPASVNKLFISHCPFLERQCKSKTKKEWPMIADVEEVWIDFEMIE